MYVCMFIYVCMYALCTNEASHFPSNIIPSINMWVVFFNSTQKLK